MRNKYQEALKRLRTNEYLTSREQREYYNLLQELVDKVTPRTEQDILLDFEKLGWEVTQNDVSCMIICFDIFARIVIFKGAKQYSMNNLCTMQEHKLLNELFQCWGWI